MSFWDQRYGEPGFAYGTAPNDWLREVAPRLPRGRALCLAEGEGRNATFLASLGFDVHAVDLSGVGLDKARHLAAERGVSLTTELADLATYVIEPRDWQVIVSIWCHLPAPTRQRLHAQVVGGLQPGGSFVLEAYTPAQLEHRTGGPQQAELMMTLAALREELAGLDLLVARELERQVSEGKYHEGPSSVVQVLATKPLADG